MILIKYFYSQVLNEFFCRITHQKIVRKVIRFRTVGAPRNLEGIAKLDTIREQFAWHIFSSFYEKYGF